MEHSTKVMRPVWASLACVGVAVLLAVVPVVAQAPLPRQPAPPPNAGAPPSYSAAELDRVVSPIALYPDPLLAQVLAASTFSPDVPDAARWADEHHSLLGAELTGAITEDRLPWDPSVQALLPFPSVLEMMASSMPWTEELGDAVLAQRADVMDAVQRQRQNAERYGYLKSNRQVTVTDGPYVEIQPVDPAYIYVPYYDPYVVFGPPRPGFFVGGALGWGYGVRIGTWFRPWGWGATNFAWASHGLIVNSAPWGRVWSNRAGYVHPYPGIQLHAGPRLPDRHPAVPRTPVERAAPRSGHMPAEAHGGERHR